jgi:hypothetical protein
LKPSLPHEPATKLRLLSAKLRSIAYLIENHHDEVGEPLDVGDIYWGIGLLLTEISYEVKSISIEMEAVEIKHHRKKS